MSVGPTKGECQGDRSRCTVEACPLFGTLRRADRDGRRRIRECGDLVASGRRAGRGGRTAQAKAARAVGVPVSTLRPGNEENYRGSLRIESKQGRQVSPAITAFRRARAQSDHARAIGDHRPFALLATADGLTVAVVALDDLPAVASALLGLDR